MSRHGVITSLRRSLSMGSEMEVLNKGTESYMVDMNN